MPSEFAISRTVEFAETDMAGIMHFSNFFFCKSVMPSPFHILYKTRREV